MAGERHRKIRSQATRRDHSTADSTPNSVLALKRKFSTGKREEQGRRGFSTDSLYAVSSHENCHLKAKS